MIIDDVLSRFREDLDSVQAVTLFHLGKKSISGISMLVK